ncbi:hypothetical protein [Streptomyces sp. 769]|uniref:hypothetical protein n=1 Tax=Streptomyces sp. 769 TaxID=1262452 RepID=UPI00058228FE|nr:hypothetical protein [Streptomyces sp. 769]AJC60187.1 LigA protein [Streptomyces sp. 769]
MSAEDIKAATTREAVLKALLDEVKAAYEEARTEVQHHLDAAQEATGARQFAASLPDGTKVGTISLTGGEPAAQIVDEQAFTAWARTAFPAERVTRIVKEMRAAFVERLLGEMTAAGVPQIVDPASGEVHEVPGVEIRPTRRRSHSVRFAKGGKGLVGEAWRTGVLAPLVLPMLAPGTADEAA